MCNYKKLFRKVLVTGATGFIGSYLVKRLVAEGIETHIIIRKDSDLSLFQDVLEDVTLHTHEGTMTSMDSILKKAGPELVYHLASYVVGDHKPDQVSNLIASNITFGCQLLEAMKSSGCNKIVNTGTFWQHYGNQDYCPVNLYAATKQSFQSILHHYSESCLFKCLSLQLFDSYGANDPRPKLLSLLKQTIDDGSTLDMTPGRQFIYLVHVSDIVQAYILGGKYLFENSHSAPKTFFVRPLTPVNLKELALLISEVVGKEIKINWGGKPYRQREIMDDINAFPTLPGWKEKIDLKSGLQAFLSIKDVS